MLFRDIILEKINHPDKLAQEYRVTVVLHDGQKINCGHIITQEVLHLSKEDPFQYLNEQITYEIAQLIMDKVQKQIYSSIDSMMQLSKATQNTTKSLSKLFGMGQIDVKDDNYYVAQKSNFSAINWEDNPLVTDEMAMGHELGVCECDGCTTVSSTPPDDMKDLTEKFHKGKSEWKEKYYKHKAFHTGGQVPAAQKSSYDFSSSSIVIELQKIFPNITQKVKHPITGKTERLNNIIVNLNDSHKWDREDIADWIETLSLDLNAQEYDATMDMVSKTPAHVSHNTGSNEVVVQKGEFSINFKFDAESYNSDIKDALAELNNLMLEKEKGNKNGTSENN